MDVYLTRSYTNNLCTQTVLANYSAHIDCLDNKSQRALDEVVEKLSSECTRIWNEAIDKLREAIPASRDRRDSQHDLPNSISQYDMTDSHLPNDLTYSLVQNDLTDSHSQPHDQMQSEKLDRDRRSLGNILSGMTSLLSIAPTLVSTFSSLYMFFTTREVEQKLSVLKTETRERLQKTNMASASIMRDMTFSIDSISDQICERDILTNSKIRQMNANAILDQTIRGTSNEIIKTV